jgi:hypothetical protein
MIEYLLKEKFKSIFIKAQVDAIYDFEDVYVPKIKDETLYEQISILLEDLEELEERASSEKIYIYYENFVLENDLLSAFATRTTLFNVDESEQLFEGVYLRTLINKLKDFYDELLDKIPPYHFNDFLKGKYCQFFNDLGLNDHLTQWDYYQIREWQAEKLMNVAVYESNILISRIQQRLQKNSNQNEIITTYLVNFELLFSEQQFNSPNELISTLSRFDFLEGYNFSILDNEAALEDFQLLKQETISWKKITPELIDHCKSRINNSKPDYAFSSSPLIFCSLLRVKNWIENMSEGKDMFEPPDSTILSRLFDQVFIDANNEFETSKETFETKYTSEILDNASKITLNSDLLNALCMDYMKGGLFLYYLEVITNKKLLKMSFVICCFLSQDIHNHSTALKQAILFKMRIIQYYRLLGSISERPFMKHSTKSKNPMEIFQLLPKMVLNAQLHKRFKAILDESMNDMNTYSLPSSLVTWVMNYKLQKLFNDSIENLLSILENCEIQNKSIYLISQLKLLKKRILDTKRLDNNLLRFEQNKYVVNLKEYLELEYQFIKDLNDLKTPFLIHSPSKNKSILEMFTNSSNSLRSTDQLPNAYSLKKYLYNISKIKQLWTSLKESKLISDSIMLKDFRKIFKNERLDNPIVWMGTLEELKYFVKLLHSDYELIDNLDKDIWKVTASIFVDKDNHNYDWQKFRGQKDPSRTEFIKSIVSHLR